MFLVGNLYRNGTNFGCVFDGVTSGGKINAYAAQAFTDFMMEWLAENNALFCFGADHSAVDIARSALEGAANPSNYRTQADTIMQAEGGSATGAFVAFSKRSDSMATLHGASIGDSAVIAVDIQTGRAQQLNPVVRKHERDTGGQVTMCIGVDGPVWTFNVEVHAGELVILTTDGFTDNVSVAELDSIVPLIIRSALFDDSVAFDCEPVLRADPEQPPLAYLQSICKDSRLDQLCSVECETAARRLFNYIEWVTRAHHQQEEAYYKLCLEAKSTVDPVKRNSIEAEVRAMAARRKAGKKVVKTDDAMIVVMHPFHTSK